MVCYIGWENETCFSAGSYTSTAKFGLHKMQKQKSRHSEDTDVGERLTGRQVS